MGSQNKQCQISGSSVTQLAEKPKDGSACGYKMFEQHMIKRSALLMPGS